MGVAKRSPDDREELLRGLLGLSFGLGGALNLLTAVVGIEGWLWHGVRVAVGIGFLVALLGWVAAFLALKRAWSTSRLRVVGVVAAAATLTLALVHGDPLVALLVTGLGAALLYEISRAD